MKGSYYLISVFLYVSANVIWGVFEGVLLLNILGNLQLVYFLLGLRSLIYSLLVYFIARLVENLGGRYGLICGFIFTFIFQILLYVLISIAANIVIIGLTGFVWMLAVGTFWGSHHIIVSRLVHLDKKLKISSLYIAYTIGSGIGTLVAGNIFDSGLVFYAIVLAGLLFLFSSIVVLWAKVDFRIEFDMSYGKFLKEVYSNYYRYLPFAIEGIKDAVDGTFWTIWLYVQIHAFDDISYIIVAVEAASLVLTWGIQKIMHTHKSINNYMLLLFGILVAIVGILLKGTSEVIWLFIVGGIMQALGDLLIDVIYDGKMYDAIGNRLSLSDEMVYIREATFHASRAIGYIVIAVLLGIAFTLDIHRFAYVVIILPIALRLFYLKTVKKVSNIGS